MTEFFKYFNVNNLIYICICTSSMHSLQVYCWKFHFIGDKLEREECMPPALVTLFRYRFHIFVLIYFDGCSRHTCTYNFSGFLTAHDKLVNIYIYIHIYYVYNYFTRFHLFRILPEFALIVTADHF